MDTNRHEPSCGFSSVREKAFTLLELIVVIAIVIVLAGLLFPAVQSVLERAKKVQAKNDLTQIVTAVNAFYTEYGQYPLVGTISTADTTYGVEGTLSDALFNELRAKSLSLNTRQIQFISPPEDNGQISPKGKIGSDSQFHDPWGNAYVIRIDADYDNQVNNPYNANTGAGPDKIRQGVVAWSVGKDTKLGNNGNSQFKDFNGTQSDDVISWQ